MPVQRTTTHADRTLLPRGLIARPSFAIDQLVTFHRITGTIVAYEISAAGHELYTVNFPTDRDRPQRTVRGEYLQALPAPHEAAIDWRMAA